MKMTTISSRFVRITSECRYMRFLWWLSLLLKTRLQTFNKFALTKRRFWTQIFNFNIFIQQSSATSSNHNTGVSVSLGKLQTNFSQCLILNQEKSLGRVIWLGSKRKINKIEWKSYVMINCYAYRIIFDDHSNIRGQRNEI